MKSATISKSAIKKALIDFSMSAFINTYYEYFAILTLASPS